jgi:hypothetical protein
MFPESDGLEVREGVVDDFKYLENTLHVDDVDGLVYEVKRVVNEVYQRRGSLIVAYRRPVYKNGIRGPEEKDAIHIRDVEKMTADTDEDIVPNPENVGLGLPFEQDKLTAAYSPTNFIFTNTYDVNNSFTNISYNLNSINLSIISFLTTKTPLYFFHQVTILLNEIEMHIYRILSSFNVLSSLNFSSLKLNLEFFFESFLNVSLPSLSELSLAFKNRNFYEQFNKLSFFKSDNGKLSDLETLYSGIESSTYTRSNKFMNSYVSYDYKCGNYLGI